MAISEKKLASAYQYDTFKANRVRSPAGSPDFRKWESCRTMPLVGGFSRGSRVSPAPSFRRCSILTLITLIGSQDLAVKSCPKSHFSLAYIVWLAWLVRRLRNVVATELREHYGHERKLQTRFPYFRKIDLASEPFASRTGISFPASVRILASQGEPDSNTVKITPDFCKWESCWTMSLVGNFSQGSPVYPTIAFLRCSTSHLFTLLGSQDLVKGRQNRNALCQYSGRVHTIVRGTCTVLYYRLSTNEMIVTAQPHTYTQQDRNSARYFREADTLTIPGWSLLRIRSNERIEATSGWCNGRMTTREAEGTWVLIGNRRTETVYHVQQTSSGSLNMPHNQHLPNCENRTPVPHVFVADEVFAVGNQGCTQGRGRGVRKGEGVRSNTPLPSHCQRAPSYLDSVQTLRMFCVECYLLLQGNSQDSNIISLDLQEVLVGDEREARKLVQKFNKGGGLMEMCDGLLRLTNSSTAAYRQLKTFMASDYHLGLAIYYSFDDMLILLLDLGLDPNSRTNQGRDYRMLHQAARVGSLRLARSLLYHGADPYRRAELSILPLSLAEWNDNKPVYELLLDVYNSTSPLTWLPY
ncbi:hypothetical protein PR048_028596 [Dryococelus australis]|uniref:Uncharacterized protein n=1 Tax=Dryococelus australis TaxID=614101 RepID=A0ABQ9GB12_9NEOP|nr:hypothetical protein PR048_028596 [Dryococelus australis]